MTDRDRLIKAWEIFRDSNPYEICCGREFRAIKEPEYCMGQMIEDTIALLKEQAEEIENLKQTAQSMMEGICLLKEQKAKTGHWVSVNDGNVVAIDDDGFPERACFCSECKKYLIASDEYAVYGRYCPFCGAKMEGR